MTYSYLQYDEKMEIVFANVLFKGELAVCLDRAFLFLTGFCLIVMLKTTDRGICAGEHIDVGKIQP